MFLRKKICDIEDLSLGELRWILFNITNNNYYYYKAREVTECKYIINEIENGSIEINLSFTDKVYLMEQLLSMVSEDNENFRINFIKNFIDNDMKELIQNHLIYVELSYEIKYKIMMDKCEHFLVEKEKVNHNIEYYNLGFYYGCMSKSYQTFKYLPNYDQWMIGKEFIPKDLNHNYDRYRKAFKIIETIYHFMIINRFEIETDIKYYLKTFYQNNKIGEFKIFV